LADYEIIIGLEIHAELRTASKIFCGCSTAFGGEPNTRCCPVCLGLPGVLPVLNEKAVEYAVMAGLALNCEISGFSKFDRKNYFYPDLPKAYQISQYDLPLAERGHMDIEWDGDFKRIGITRVHLEEEAGKSVHSGDTILDSDYSLIDYNRVGIPLIEIVTEPDLRSPEQARLFLENLRSVLQYTGVSDCKMEEGSLRCDANISLRPVGISELGTKVEVKNMNSFRAVERALMYEAERQRRMLEAGERITQDTRHWDEAGGRTVSMRSKEEAHDYRYFPEPDLVPVVIDREWLEQIRKNLPEMPLARRQRFIEEYDLPEYDAGVLTDSKALADFFEECVAVHKDAKAVSNWVMGELLRLLKESNQEISDCQLLPGALADMLKMIDDGIISGKIAKTVFEEMFKTGKTPETIVQEKGLKQISDTGELGAIVDRVIEQDEDAVAEFQKGNKKVLGYFVGQVMRATRGKANPQLVNELLREKLSQ